MEGQNLVNLRPRTIVELVDQAIRLYRNNFVKFVGIVAIALVPVQLIQLLFNVLSVASTRTGSVVTQTDVEVLLRATVLNLVILMLTTIFVNGVANAALTSAIASSYLGEEISIGGAYSKIRNSWGRLIGAIILLFLLGIVFGLWFIVPCVGWLTGIGIIFFLSMVISPLVAPVIVIENQSGMTAIRRAWDLVRRRFWWIIGYFTLLLVINLLVIQGPVQIVSSLIQRYISSTVGSAQFVSYAYLQLIANSITTLLLSLIYIPLESACATLVYFDLRIRQEGFDLAMMANQTSETPVAAVELASQPAGVKTGSLVTGTEIAYFILLSIAVAGIYLGLAFIVGLGVNQLL